MKINARHMQGIPETLLFTLYLRCRECIRPDGKLSDRRYAELVENLDYDFSLFDDIPDGYQLSIACRTIIFDRLTRQFIEMHPQGVVVSLGSGLDFRFDRVDNGHIAWFDIDLPEVIALREKFFPDTARRRSIASSVPEFSWMEAIPSNMPVLFLAEGLFMYFTPRQVKKIFSTLSRGYQDAEIILDVHSNWYINAMKNTAPTTFLRKMAGMWQWGMDYWEELGSLAQGIQFIEEYYQRDGFGDRMPEDLKQALSGDGYAEHEREIIRNISRIGHIRL